MAGVPDSPDNLDLIPERVQHSWNQRRGFLEIARDKAGAVALGVLDARPDRHVRPYIARKLDSAHAPVTLANPGDVYKALIAAAVVDKNELVLEIRQLLGEAPGDLGVSRIDTFAFAIDRNDY